MAFFKPEMFQKLIRDQAPEPNPTLFALFALTSDPCLRYSLWWWWHLLPPPPPLVSTAWVKVVQLNRQT